jgi:hypothetical protein
MRCLSTRILATKRKVAAEQEDEIGEHPATDFDRRYTLLPVGLHVRPAPMPQKR